ncbi:unnamed protein product, partial [Brachionus calyciflorus]
RFIDTFCSNMSFTINKMVACSSTVATFNKEDMVLLNSANDLKREHNFSNDSYILYFGIPIPTFIDNIDGHSMTGEFVLPLTEFKFEAYAVGFEFYAYKTGEILVSIDENKNCGNSISCNEYLMQNYPDYNNWQTAGSIKLNLVKGYNKIMIPGVFEIIKKGSMMKISQSNPIVAIDKGNDSIFSDFICNSQGLIKLNYSANWRFYANVIIDKSYMTKTFEFSLVFDLGFNETFRNFNVTIKFLDTDFELKRFFNISQTRYLDINCPNSNKTLNETIKCSVIGISQIKGDFLNIWFDGEEIKNYSLSDPNQKETASFFGFYDTMVKILDPISVDFVGEFVMPNTEFRMDANMVGFECYVVTPGTINLWVLDMGTNCNKLFSCSEYFYKLSGYDTRINLGFYTLVKGYNKLQLKRAYKVKKGQILSFSTTNSNLMGLNLTENGMMTDFKGQDYYAKLNQEISWRFYFNAIVDKFFYVSHFYLSKRFTQLKNDTFEISYLNAEIERTNVKFNRMFNVTIVRIPLIEEITLYLTKTRHVLDQNLFFVFVSSYFYDEINIKFGNDEIIKINVTDDLFNLKNYFGLSMLNESNNIAFKYDHYQTFILTNTEVRFSTEILGFELYVYQPGVIILGIQTFSECGREISCANFLEEYGTIPKVNFSTSKEYIVSKGYNQLYLREKIKIAPGSMVFMSSYGYNPALVYVSREDALVNDYKIINQVLYKINVTKNIRFQVNMLINEDSFYEYMINVNYDFPSYGIHTMNLGLIGQTNNYYKNISLRLEKNQNVDVYCKDSNHTLDKRLGCYVIATSMNKTDTLLLPSENLTVSFQNETVDYFGNYDRSKNITNIVSTTLTGLFLLTNTEFYFDAYSYGFEIFAADSGNIVLEFVNSCGQQCVDSIISNYPSYKYSKTGFCSLTVDVKKGYNKINNTQQCWIKKGQIVLLSTSKPGIVAINITESEIVSDFNIQFYPTTIQKINPYKNSRFYVNALIDRSYYSGVLTFIKNFNNKNNTHITATYDNSNKTLTRYYEVTERK